MEKKKLLKFLLSQHKFRESQFKQYFFDYYVELSSIVYPNDFTFRQKLYHFLNDDYDLKLGICETCGNRCKFESLNVGYKKHCSKKCAIIEFNKHHCLKSNNNNISCDTNNVNNKEDLYMLLINKHHIIQNVFAKNYKTFYDEICSIEFPKDFTFSQKLYHWLNNDIGLKLGLCECNKRCKYISLKLGYRTYCCTQCSSKSKDVQDKQSKTCFKKYGVKYAQQSKIIKDKIVQTNLKKYGVSHPIQNKSIKEKTKQTNLDRYGVTCTLESEEIKEKAKQTNLDRYGVVCTLESKKVKEKIRKTNLKKYGVSCVLDSKEIKEKIKQANLDKYGVENPMQSKEIKEKTKQTNLKRYGVACTLESKEIKEKIKQTNLERYGVENPTQSKEIKEKTTQTNLDKYGVPYTCMREEARQYSNDSKPNMQFADILENNNINYEREFNLEKYSYDFKIDNILVEINPTITHNSYLNIFNDKPKTSYYHLQKTNIAKKYNYSCIHIFDWDDTNKILNILKPKNTLYARNLTVKEVSKKECDIFLNNYHLQNSCKGQLIRCGLYISNILVEVMTFGKPRYNKNYDYELLRLCSHKDYKIVGGSERLFKYFIKTYNPKSIISYCDNSKFNGGVYFRLGFKLKNISEPSRHWYNSKAKQHITDNLLRQRGFDQLFNTNYGKGTSNEDLMIERGFLPIYDCGQFVFDFINFNYI